MFHEGVSLCAPCQLTVRGWEGSERVPGRLRKCIVHVRVRVCVYVSHVNCCGTGP